MDRWFERGGFACRLALLDNLCAGLFGSFSWRALIGRTFWELAVARELLCTPCSLEPIESARVRVLEPRVWHALSEIAGLIPDLVSLDLSSFCLRLSAVALCFWRSIRSSMSRTRVLSYFLPWAHEGVRGVGMGGGAAAGGIIEVLFVKESQRVSGLVAVEFVG